MPTILAPTAELVAMAWISQIPGIASGTVATNLPSDNSTLAASGFTTVMSFGGAPELYTGLRYSLMQVDCWAAPPTGNKPPWFRANALAETIVGAAQGWQRVLLTKTATGVVATKANYDDAYVSQVHVLSDPRRMPADSSALARYLFELRFVWRSEPKP